MYILYLLLILLIILVIYLIFLMKNNKNNNSDLKYEIIEKMMEKNNDTKEDITRLMYENKGDLSKDIIEFKDTLKTSVEKNIFELVDKVEKKLVENNEISKSSTKNMVEFKETLKLGIDKNIDDLITKVNIKLKEGFETNDKTFKEVIERLAVMDKTQDEIKKLSKDILSLENILNDKKSRGAFGEVLLKQVLENIYGINNTANNALYELQYTLYTDSNNKKYVKPDAVVYLQDREKIVCIDSKFPLENYKYLDEINDDKKKIFISGVKSQIDKISNDYVSANINTIDLAIMFIPSESVFMEIYSKFYNELVEYAQKKKVFIASPSTLMMYLTTINLVNLNYKQAKNAKKILEELKKLNDKFNTYDKKFNELENNFGKIYNGFIEVNKTKAQIMSNFNRINMLE